MTGVAASGVAGAEGPEEIGPGLGISADDAAYWASVAAQYDLPPEIIQLEHGNWGAMARPVLEAHERHLARVNRETSFYGRRAFGADLSRVRARAAASLGVTPEEIVFTRNATEALQALIGGYNRLRPGDAVLYSDHDYDAMQWAMGWLPARRGAAVVTIALPEPATHQSLIDAYDAALRANPRVRLMLLTQVSHRNGLVLPVAEIVALARSRGVDAIVDSAHAWGQLNFTLPDLGADFVGLNGHKWIGAPLGVGVAYIRRARLGDIDPYMNSQDGADDIRARVHTGTTSLATMLSLGDALDFHDRIGLAAKAGRLKWLRDRWTDALRDDGRFEILTPADPRLSGALTSFRLRGQTAPEQNRALARALLERFRIFTVDRIGLASGACVRVTPSLANSAGDLDALIAALRTLAGA